MGCITIYRLDTDALVFQLSGEARNSLKVAATPGLRMAADRHGTLSVVVGVCCVAGVYRRIWRSVYWTAGINLAFLFGSDLAMRLGLLPPTWSAFGPDRWVTLGLVAWAFLFIWRFAIPIKTGVRMVLLEHVNRIDYIFLLGIAFATISFYALIYFFLLRIDPTGIHFVTNATGAADLLFFSTVVFVNMGFDLLTPIGWWPRLVALSETLLGLGYLAGLVALLTNRLSSEAAEPAQAGVTPVPPGPDLVEGTAVAAGTATGAAIGSVAGPVGTIVGAVAGAIVADESTDRADQFFAPDPPERH